MGFADPVDYIVVSFEGDYAMLRKADEPDAQLILHLTVTKLRSDL